LEQSGSDQCGGCNYFKWFTDNEIDEEKLTASSSSSPSPPNTTVNAMVWLLPSNELVK